MILYVSDGEIETLKEALAYFYHASVTNTEAEISKRLFERVRRWEELQASVKNSVETVE